ncbi:PDGLE domain-containing protein [Phycicoccus sp.]|uniref:PDGLE domain-containing protein n=1 Tax=Phycicoccus sp. TaxID=1902410 RepID=UPI002BC36F7F|nr:PDGLE domain-containing protein [Phycicoccus sp.]HMM96350.1 PDGLE domain-containing protein [Phycicoccus sp.]
MSSSTAPPRVSTRRLVVVGLAVCLVIAGVVSFYASSHPDGLEYVAHSLGFGDAGRASAADGSPLAGYGVEGVSDSRLSGGLAGVIGAVVVGVLMTGLVLLVRRRAPRGRD